MKYPLLFRELIKYTDDDHPDLHDLKQVLEKIENILKQINESKRVVDQTEAAQQKMKEIAKKMDNSGQHIFDVKENPYRTLAREGDVTWKEDKNSSELHYFLFNGRYHSFIRPSLFYYSFILRFSLCNRCTSIHQTS